MADWNDVVISLRTEGAKVMVALNGGGAVAMLGFMQALAGKAPEMHVFKPFGMGALFAFAIGAFAGGEAFYRRAKVTLSNAQQSAKQARRHHIFAVVMLFTIRIAFLSGVTIAGIGIYRAL